MQPPPASSDHPQPFETATTDGLPLTVSVPSVLPDASIVVLHEIWGMTAPVAALTARLAGCSYLAAAPHLYHRIENPNVENPNVVAGRYTKARRHHDTLTVDGLTSDIESALAWLRARGTKKVAIIGFSMGGTLALWAAATWHIDAAVTFYGAGLASPRWPGILNGIDAAQGLKAPWLGIYAGKDASTPARDLKQIREALSRDGGPSDLVIYPNARHGFALDPDQPHHAADETRDASKRVHLFLKTHLQ